ncbi:MAG: Ig-like domain-containing protein, partial [Acidobacteria bacterium]|nr:Ig-like domain-containing protein [Acidobacteriota bacterium]
MKLFLTIVAAIIPVFLAAGLAVGSQSGDLRAVYNLSGILQGLENKELSVTFSDDMLPLGGRRDGASVITITPAVKGEFFWRGNRTLAFKPDPRFRYSTTYTAVIKAGTKSLSGQVLAKEIRWQWSTPQAYPVEIKVGARDYFSQLTPGEKLDYTIWVRDSITLRFDQPVSAADAKSFFVLKETKRGETAAIQVAQKASDQLEIRFPKELKRGLSYQFLVQKGFCGSEGNSGTAKAFSFNFDTVPLFQYTGRKPLVLFPDAPYCWLPFSNSLAEFPPSLIRVFKVSGLEKTPLKFELERRHYGNEALFVNISDELASGDALLIQVDRSLTNIYKEQLPEALALDIKVCSSRSPRLHFSLQEKKIALSAASIKRADLRLIKFKPDFYARLLQRDYGILQEKNFKSDFIEKEILQQLADLPEKTNTQALRTDELGSRLGFFGFLVQRYEPYNTCRDIALMRLPAQMPQDLQVFHRRNMDMVVKTSPEQTLYWLYDNRTGKSLGEKPFFVKEHAKELLPIGKTAADGTLLSDKPLGQPCLVMAKNPADSDMALVRIDHEPMSAREVRITAFSERDFYKPGDTVHLAGIVKEYVSGKITSSKTTSATLEIIGPDWQKVKSDTLRLDPLGGFHYEYKSDAGGKKGRYQFQVAVQNGQQWQANHSVTIDYYQPNTLEMRISALAERYLPEDTFRPLLSGAYLAGNPMAGDAFTYSLALNQAAGRVPAFAGLERYHFGLDNDLEQRDPPQQGGDKLDAGGKFTLGIPMAVFRKTNFLADLHFTTTGRSAEGKEFTARAGSVYFPGSRLTGIHVGYYQNLKEQVGAELALVDFQGKPAAGEVRVTLYRETYDTHRRQLKKVAGPDDVYIEKTKIHSFRVPAAGRYVLRCDTPDAKGRVLSTSAGFFAWDSGYSDRDDNLGIESEQETLRIGEKLKCFIRSPRPGQALVTVERGKVLDSWTIDLQKMTPLEIEVRKEYFPAFRISIIAMYEENVSEETKRDFQVVDEGKTLRIAMQGPEEIKPAAKATVKIRVRDQQQKGVRTRLFIYAVDEGNLSLQGYRTPDPLQRFYHVNPLGRSAIRTYYSKNFSRWAFERPFMDIDLPAAAIFGCISRPDAIPIAGATVTLEDEKFRKLKTTTTSAQGYYSFIGLPSGRYAIKAEASGCHPFLVSEVYFNGGSHAPCDLVLIPVAADKYWDAKDEFGPEGGVLGGVLPAAPAAMAQEMKSMARRKGEGEAEDGVSDGAVAGADISGIRVRSDFKEVLFFKVIETDEAGNAVVDFKSSDQLSTYRIMAVAYGEDRFGKAEKKLVVSKDLLIAEAMPEFARQGDEFQAGAQLSNRTAQKLPFTLLAKPAGIAIRGAEKTEGILDPRGNGLFRFLFTADRIGEAKVEFFALSAADKDGLEKRLFVSDRLVSETLLDFASGKQLKKAITPQSEVEEQAIAIKVAPSLLRPAVNIAKKLVFYPFECLEQRTSKVMPFLALSPQLAERLELGLDPAQVREAVNSFLKIIPEFMNSDGALSYYRGGQYSSDYLTAYVLWALHLARERDYKVDPQLVQKLSA